MLETARTARLRRSDFSFYCYDDLIPELDAFLDDVWIRGGDPVAPTVENAVFVPAFELAWGHYEGCLLSADGEPIPTAISHRRFGAFGNQIVGTLSEPVAIAPEREIDDEVVYLGWYIDHFGHILLEGLSRMWILDQIDPATKVVFHVQGPLKLSTIGRRILETFGIPEDRILFLDTQTRLRRVIVPEALYEISYAAHKQLPRAYREAAATIVSSGVQSDQPVYLSRRLLSSRQRPIVGELEMEEVFRENGFLVVHSETMSFDEQVRLINRHRDVFTSAGSAAYLPLFALRPPTIHTLTSGIPFHDYFLVPKAIGAEAAFCNCFTGDNRPSHYYLPPVLAMDTLAGYLDARGLLKNRLRASLTARVRDVQPEHDEQRLFAYAQYFTLHSRALPAEIEAEALVTAQSSWPLCWILARYYMLHDPSRIDPLIQQFAALLEGETDVNRLVHFYPDVRAATGKVLRHCQRRTAARATMVFMDRLLIDLAAEKARRVERRRAREQDGQDGSELDAARPAAEPSPALSAARRNEVGLTEEGNG